MTGDSNPNKAHRLDRVLSALRSVRGSIQMIARANPLWAHVERVLEEIDADPEATATRPRLSVLTHNVENMHALLLQSLHGTHRDVFDKLGLVQPPKLQGKAEAAEWMHKATGRRYLVIVVDAPPVTAPASSPAKGRREVLCERSFSKTASHIFRLWRKG